MALVGIGRSRSKMSNVCGGVSTTTASSTLIRIPIFACQSTANIGRPNSKVKRLIFVQRSLATTIAATTPQGAVGKAYVTLPASFIATTTAAPTIPLPSISTMIGDDKSEPTTKKRRRASGQRNAVNAAGPIDIGSIHVCKQAISVTPKSSNVTLSMEKALFYKSVVSPKMRKDSSNIWSCCICGDVFGGVRNIYHERLHVSNFVQTPVAEQLPMLELAEVEYLLNNV